MLRYFHILIFLFLAACCEEKGEECPCYTEHQFPRYKGCAPGTIYDESSGCSTMGLYDQLYSVLKYPQEARDDSVEGRVTIAFDIYEDGSIGNYTVFKDTLGYGLADAAIEAIKTFNERGFCPAREQCDPVVYNFKLPVLFVLQ